MTQSNFQIFFLPSLLYPINRSRFLYIELLVGAAVYMHMFRECRKYLVYVRNFDSDTVPFRDLLVCQHNWVYGYSPHFSSIVTRNAVSSQGEIDISSCRRIPCFRILNRFLKGYYSIFSIFSFRFSTPCGLPVRKWFLNTTSYVLGKCEKVKYFLLICV